MTRLSTVAGGGLMVLCICTVLLSGCTDETNQTPTIYPGYPTPDLVTDMEYRPLDLPLHVSEVPAGITMSNQTVGILKDGTLLFKGIVSNTREKAVPGYTIAYIEVLGNDSAPIGMSPPMVSPRDLPAGGSFPYYYFTLEPVGENATGYRFSVQVSTSYPGV
jgi:hypothetical protein